jgi:hypothetical protein
MLLPQEIRVQTLIMLDEIDFLNKEYFKKPWIRGYEIAAFS